MIENQDYIAHYGVLGMRWGIRRYQPYPKDYKGAGKEIGKAIRGKERSSYFTEKRTIPAGATMYRVTTNRTEGSSGSKYVTYLEPDRDLYRGTYTGQLKSYKGRTQNDPLYEKSYQLTKDLKIPSRSEVKEVQTEILKDPKVQKEVISDIVEQYVKLEEFDFILNYGNDYKKEMERQGKEFTEQMIKDYNKNMSLDEQFIVTSRGMGPTESYKEKVIKELSNRGYNAMVDEAGVGGVLANQREGIDPLIVFDGNVLSETESHQISRGEQARAERKSTEWLRKSNQNRSRPW